MRIAHLLRSPHVRAAGGSDEKHEDPLADASGIYLGGDLKTQPSSVQIGQSRIATRQPKVNSGVGLVETWVRTSCRWRIERERIGV